MDRKLLVTLRGSDDASRVTDTGATVIAEYPDRLLVRASDAQIQTLKGYGIDVVALGPIPIKVGGLEFAFQAAQAAEAAVPISSPPADRIAYYLVKAVGPVKGEWLAAIKALGGSIHGTLPGDSLLIGLLPPQVSALASAPWVEGITPFRPSMKVAPRLRPDSARTLDASALEQVSPPSTPEPQQIEVSVFPGESTASVAQKVREAGGTILRESASKVAAIVPSSAIAEIAERQGVQAILPHKFPELHNDRARQIVTVPVDNVFPSGSITGSGQIIGIADSGLDTGDPATVHRDIRARLAGLTSWPSAVDNLAVLSHNTPPFDDGPADRNSGHGTHVTGSVAGDGTEAAALGNGTLPRGVAVEAQVFLQSIEQRINWKSRNQLIAVHQLDPGNDWPPPAVGLYGIPNNLAQLFNQAYVAGARIHTNSWGAAVDGVYNQNSLEVDDFMFTHTDMLILFSAGNDGQDSDGDGIVDPDSIGSPGTAKNCLTVGASESRRPAGSTPPPGADLAWTGWRNPDGSLRFPALGHAGHVSDNQDGMAAFSSRGPTDDGRIKPDVVAPGTNILSLRSSAFTGATPPGPLWGDLNPSHPLTNLYCWSGGTSMSTPIVAGCAALVRQHLMERGHHISGSRPSGALIKAFLVNGCVPLSGQFPNEIPDRRQNNVSGFGRVSLEDSLAPGGTAALFSDESSQAVESGQSRVHLVTATGSRPLKVTLAWSDAPSIVGDGSLENRLYLRVRKPDGVFVDGDVTPFPTPTNNVQQVVLSNPVAGGVYEVRIEADAIVRQAPGAAGGINPRQDFALVVSGGDCPTLN